MNNRQLRKRARPNYKEPTESDIYLPSRDPKSSRPHPTRKSDSLLYPIEILEEESNKFKIHYIGYSSKYDEWKDKDDVIDLHDDPVENFP